MNVPKVVAGTAALVVALFWAILVIDLLSVYGTIVVIAAPYVVLLAVGAYAIVDGLAGQSAQPRGSASRAGRRLGALDMMILQMISQGKSQQEMAAATAVSAAVIAEKIKTLTKAGFLYENSLSEKGFEVLRTTS